MAVALRFDGSDNEVAIPDSADWDMGDAEDLAIGFWSKLHPDGDADMDWITRENWWRFGIKKLTHQRFRPYFTLHGGETVYFDEAEPWIRRGTKHMIGLQVTSPTILDGDRTAAADTNTASHLVDADGTDWTTVAAAGDIAYNVTDGTYGVITVVEAHDLTLATDAFPDGNEVYLIIDEDSFFNIKLYVDGVLRSTKSFADYQIWPAAAATLIYFGSYNSASEFLLGDANELFIAEQVVTAAEWKVLYNNGVELEALTGVTADGHWSFDEGTGTTVDEDGGTAGKDGTVAGTELWLTTMDISVKEGILDLHNQLDYYQGRLKVQEVLWIGPTTNAHLVALTNWAGDPFVNWQEATVSLGTNERIPMYGAWVNGIKVTDLDSGYVRLVLR